MREKYCNGDYSSLVALHSFGNSIVVSPALDLLIKKLHIKQQIHNKIRGLRGASLEITFPGTLSFLCYTRMVVHFVLL